MPSARRGLGVDNNASGLACVVDNDFLSRGNLLERNRSRFGHCAVGTGVSTGLAS